MTQSFTSDGQRPLTRCALDLAVRVLDVVLVEHVGELWHAAEHADTVEVLEALRGWGAGEMREGER